MSTSFDLHSRGAITAVDAFIREVSAVREETNKHKLWFRGHSRADFKLIPTIGREATVRWPSQDLQPRH